MVTSNFAWFAYDFGVADVRVWGMAALPLALTIDRLMNGFTRPFFGWVSDRIGRENTMGLAFLLEAAAILLLLEFRSDPVAFVALSGLVFFGWGEIFSLFPSTLTDTFGARHATTNFPLRRSGARLGARRTAGRGVALGGRQLDARLPARRSHGCSYSAAGAVRAEGDAASLCRRRCALGGSPRIQPILRPSSLTVSTPSRAGCPSASSASDCRPGRSPCRAPRG